MTEPAQQQADEFARYMTNRFGATVIRKRDAIHMRWIAEGLALVHNAGVEVPGGDEFLDRFATTIGPWIYMPDGFSPATYMEVLTHECQHVHQFHTHGLGLPGGLGMWWLYIAAPEARVRYEAEAYRAGLEVAYWRTKRLPSLDDLAMPLEGGYALDEGSKTLGRDMLDLAATSVSAGQYSTAAGRAAIDWFRLYAPELEGAG